MTMFGQCCFCISLSTGTKAIGIAYTIISALMAVVYLAPLLLAPLPPAKTAAYGALAAAAALHGLLGAVLLVGAFKFLLIFQKKPRCLWPWVLVSWALGVTLLVLCAVGAVLLLQAEAPATPDFMAVMVYYFVYGLTLLYFGLVVKARADELAWDQTYLRRRMRYTDLRAMSARLYS